VAIKRGVSGINLLPKDSFEFSIFGKILKWVTTIGRVLVVMTEFVVLLAFGSRFYFDKKLDDLNETIIQKQAQIQAYGEVESSIRKILAKQQPVEAYMSSGLNFGTKIDNLTKVVPSGTTVDSLNLTKNGMTVIGKAQSEYGFAQLISGLKRLEGVTNISMRDTIFDQTSGGVKFNVQLTFKDGQSN